MGREEARKNSRRAVFLDRDGTINVEKDYLHRVEDFAFIEGAPQAIKRLNDAGFLVIVVTNQSGIARGFFGAEDVDRLHEHIRLQLKAVGAKVDGFYVCPHHPTEGEEFFRKDCDCRKGRPGMLLQAAEAFDIDLGSSWIVGDKTADIEAGLRAGCRPILVQTGYGAAEQSRLGPYRDATRIAADLEAAADIIVAASS